MKTRLILISFVFTLCITVCAGEVMLGEFDLAGMPIDSPPPSGSILRLEPESTRAEITHWAVHSGDRKIGYIPARFHAQMEHLLRDRTRFTLRVQEAASSPRPGQFLRVALWVTPRFPGEEFPAFTSPEDPETEWALTETP
ncbi:MAG: hypothetical protein JJU05_01155 [Verrucomicrobia bacterium]|nr:hypothetical protein [Verrucomicrobiota bacterium]MCH8525908.1 hypothetical protein [Kiritimatiellia bacterium]